MAQKLIMPYKECIILAGYKIAGYQSNWGYPHYGIDLFSWWGEDGQERGKVRASGRGMVVAAGWDKNVGNVVVVVYEDVFLRKTGQVQDLAARYYHLETLSVGEGERVTAGTLLGMEGNTQTNGYHCHLELDTDYQYPTWSPQVSPGGEIIIKGLDTTLNPSEVLYRQEGQTVKPCTAANRPNQNKWTADWNTWADLAIPFVDRDEDLQQKILELTTRLRQMTAERQSLVGELQRLIQIYEL